MFLGHLELECSSKESMDGCRPAGPYNHPRALQPCILWVHIMVVLIILCLTASRVVATEVVQENDNGTEVSSAGALTECHSVSDDEWILIGF